MVYLAFPYRNYLPPQASELAPQPRVPPAVRANLGEPVFLPNFRRQVFRAGDVSVPETTFDEDDEAISEENDIGSPGQVSAMEGVAETSAVEKGADGQFGLRVLGLDAGHEKESGRGLCVAAHTKHTSRG